MTWHKGWPCKQRNKISIKPFVKQMCCTDKSIPVILVNVMKMNEYKEGERKK